METVKREQTKIKNKKKINSQNIKWTLNEQGKVRNQASNSPLENIKGKDKCERANRLPGKPNQEEPFGCCQIL